MAIRFFDMFAGIGGFRSGLEAVGGFECIGHCEIDKKANQAYNAIYQPKGEIYFEDATKIDTNDLPDIDLICAGFPCQSFSVAGKRLGFRDASMLLTNSLGLSLSDQYWIRPQGSDISWEDVNFFDNPFSEDVGDLLFGHHVGEGEIDLNSPDNTSDGNLRKRWKIVDGRRCLIKSGTRPMFQEPFNEVAASMLAEAAGIPHVDYRIVPGGGDPCCICPDFITRDTELVTAHSVLLSDGLDGGVRMLERYVGACRYHGLDVRDDVNAMIAFDHIIANTDRHTNNFGIIRDAETLEWLSSAPLYDNGTSLGTNVLTADLTSDLITGCKPFADTFRKQIGLVSTLDGIDTESMRGEIPKIRNLMEEGIRYLGDGRSDAVCSLISDRLDEVESRRERMLTWHVPAV